MILYVPQQQQHSGITSTGITYGDSVGCKVGERDGDKVGLIVGESVGVNDGLIVLIWVNE